MHCNVEIIGHRGASFDAPENTASSVRLAWQQGADAVEVDVRLSRDGQVVVMHDPSTLRTAGVDAKVSDLTMAELRALDAGAWKGPRWAGERIPTLDELLALTPAARQMLIEVKCGPEVCGPLRTVLDRWAGDARQAALCGFSDATMEAVKEVLPEHQIYLISHVLPREENVPVPPAAHFVQRARAAGLDGLSLAACDAIDTDFVSEIHSVGLPLVVWTVDSPAQARQMLEAGVDAIATNRPGWLRQQLSEEASA